MSDVVTAVAEAVEALSAAMPDLLEQCTDPQATDMAEILATVQEARQALQTLERDVEAATAKAMVGDYAETATLRVERSRAAERKSWDHESWQRDVRRQILRKHGLLNVAAVVTADGEELDPAELGAAMAELQAVHGSTGPRLTQLRATGLDPDDYATRTPGRWTVRVTRMADESAEVA